MTAEKARAHRIVARRVERAGPGAERVRYSIGMSTWDPFEARPEIVGQRYRIAEVLGSGGSGCVYRALDEKTGAEVAVKLVEAPALHRPLRFLAEARDMARLRHPRVVRVLDLGQQPGWYWCVLELMPGGSLQDKVGKDGPMAPADALRNVFMVLQGLHAVHSASLVHRDIKPHNVLLDADRQPRLTDFGLARHEAGDVPWRTRTGESLGSPAYRAPEQTINPAIAGREADIYGVGGLLYFLVTGKRPAGFYMMSDAEFANATADLPEGVAKVVRRATLAQPDARFRTAVEMASAVARAYDALPERANRSPVVARWMAAFEQPEPEAATPSLWQRLFGWIPRG